MSARVSWHFMAGGSAAWRFKDCYAGETMKEFDDKRLVPYLVPLLAMYTAHSRRELGQLLMQDLKYRFDAGGVAKVRVG